jgi:RND family efflux transporter MFP subunit
MKAVTRAIWAAVVLGITFQLGSFHGRRQTAAAGEAGGKKILYYVDPMNPAHTSDQPGLAPCGMKMEAVYAESTGPTSKASNAVKMLPGMVQVSQEKQPWLGMQVGIAEKKSVPHTIRLLGRVAIDETRLYRINATVDGWITKAQPLATGSVVKRQDLLAAFYSPEFLSAGQALLFALDSMDRVTITGRETAAQSNQVSQFTLNLRQYQDSLKNLGMGEVQIQEMIRTRKFMESVDITAPAGGVITARNVSEGQRFDKGTELYRIADISHVWILADVQENDAPFIKPGMSVRVARPKQPQTFAATVSQALPQFDAGSRTLKVRLEAENPDLALKPEMFVDLEVPILLPETLVIAADAVLDSGQSKTVFVARDQGIFEPRSVATGRQWGDQVEILEGLAAGEQVVTAGNFLLDSESRMKMAAAGGPGTSFRDPVCGMAVAPADEKAEKLVSTFQGKAYYFCNPSCQHTFDRNPAKYAMGKAPQPNHAVPAQASPRQTQQ